MRIRWEGLGMKELKFPVGWHQDVFENIFSFTLFLYTHIIYEGEIAFACFPPTPHYSEKKDDYSFICSW